MSFFLPFLCAAALAADANKPHPHQGLIPSFEGAPPSTELTPEELSTLFTGQPVFRKNAGENEGRGVAIFRVMAPAEVVWSVILDYDKYPEWIHDLKDTEIYHRTDDLLYTTFSTKVMGMDIEWYIRHIVNTKEGWVTWTLDYQRDSDLSDSVGYWRVTPSKKDPNICRVEYSVNLKIRSWVPRFVKKMLVDQGLEEATSWVRIQAEARQKAPVGGP
ncbi:MAG: SRPBCC family protein [Myxococcota bacterium]|nr:SRPBCC family protein [Myxococcota bacterium]